MKFKTLVKQTEDIISKKSLEERSRKLKIPQPTFFIYRASKTKLSISKIRTSAKSQVQSKILFFAALIINKSIFINLIQQRNYQKLRAMKMDMEAEHTNLAPTIRQVYFDLKQSYHELDQTFSDLGIECLPVSEDLEYKKITLRKIISNIPTQQQLEAKIKMATKNGVRETMNSYSGTNQLITKARQSYSELKKQQQKIYFLAADLSMPGVSPEFKDGLTINLSHLHSYHEITQIKKTRGRLHEKNIICNTYFQDDEVILNQKQTPTKLLKKGSLLKKLDLLVHINYYDSHNTEKQYQFVCIQDQHLIDIVDNFKCLIDKLKNIQRVRKKSDSEIESQAVYDKDVEAPLIPEALPQGKANYHNQRKNPKNQRYLFIQNTIYYEGNLKELEPLINEANKSKVNYRFQQISRTKLADIRVVFGKPYLYRHLEGCDHIIIFKTARLFLGNDQFNKDILQLEKYPITVFESKMKRKKCEGCFQYFADIVAIADPLKNGQNLYLCIECHKDLHLDENGKEKYSEKIKFVNYIHE